MIDFFSSFRFPSSYEAHNSRRSWILGYWCQNCFFTECCHVPEGQSSCSDCQKKERQRKSSLRAKGLRKGRKLGTIQIFYNQCQFFAHLNAHETAVVDLADIMLMPMPTDVDRESYAELDRLCASIMERMFLTRTHIMDWLGSQQLGTKWWKLLQASSENDEDPLEKIFAATSARAGRRSMRYTGNSITASPAASPGFASAAHYSSIEKTRSSISETIESVVAQSEWTETVPPPLLKDSKISHQRSNTSVDPLESIENDDDPCTTADIAFVDCGPAAKTYPPDVAILLPPKDKLTIIPNTSQGCSSVVMPVKIDSYQSLKPCGASKKLNQHEEINDPPTTSVSTSSPANQRVFEPKISVKNFANELLNTPDAASCEKNYSRFSNQKPQGLRKLVPASTVRVTNATSSLSSSKDIIRAVEISKKVQGSLSTLGPRILTVHSSKNADLSKIISQLPPDVINGKKIVFIGQDAEPLTILPKNEVIASGRGMIKIHSEADRAKILQTLPTVASNLANEQSLRILSETSKKDPQPSKPKSQQVYLDGKVIYRNGKKFVIRHTRKPAPDITVCNSLNSLKLQTIPKPVSLTSFLSKSCHPVTSYLPIETKPVDPGAIKVLSTCTTVAPSSSSSPPLSPSPSLEDPKRLTSRTEVTRNGNDSTRLEEVHPPTCGSLSAPLMSKASSQDAVEYFSIKCYAAGRPYIDFTAPTERNWTKIPGNPKRRLLKHLSSLSSRRISVHIDHLRSTNAEYARMIGVRTDARIMENSAAIKEADKVLENRHLCPNEGQDIDYAPGYDDYKEILLRLKETNAPLFTCVTCNKPAKSKSHIAGFLDDSLPDLDCCSCNNYMCHICGLFQGNRRRFKAHLNFHSKTEPFTCPECFRKFTTFDLLETHVWTTCFHPLARRWFRCKVCQFEGFLDMDSLTKHFVLAHSTLRVGCTHCGMLLLSRGAFEKHRKDDHPELSNSLKPLYLMACEFGNCIVRLKDFRSHMEDHRGVIQMLYFKCFFCPYLIQEESGGREQIQIHLRDSHSDELSQLVPSVKMSSAHSESTECQQSFVNLEHHKSSNGSEDNSESGNNPFAEVHSDENDQGLTKLRVSETVRENTDALVDELPTDCLDAKPTKQTSKNGVDSSVWSINSEHPELFDPMDVGTASLKKVPASQQEPDTSENVITEYSSSPKIFDVRSVTPDSYAHLGQPAASSLSKKVTSMAMVEHKALEKSTSASEDKTTDFIRVKMLPVKLPQILAINQGGNNTNLSRLQPSVSVTKKFVEIKDLMNLDTKSGTSNAAESVAEQTDKETIEPRVLKVPTGKTAYTLGERCKSLTNDSTSATNLPGSLEVQLKLSVDSKKVSLPVSLLKSKNKSTQPITIEIEPNNLVPSSLASVRNVTNREIPTDPLLCNIPKPPPLARMPQRLLEASQLEVEVEENEPLEITASPSRSVAKLKQRQKRPWRMALNGPVHTSELISYKCHLCGELLNTSWSVLRRHFNSRHSDDYKLSIVTPRLLQMSSDFIAEGYKEVLGSKKRKSDPIFPCSKRRKRWNPRKHIDNHSLGPGICVQQESVQDGEGHFVCKKCDQQCDDISSLRQHIGMNHRIKDHYLVCLECGENFVVEPSLQMHLKAFHRIQDPCTYMAQNTGYARKLPEIGESESSTGIANQCHVCMAVFEDKLAVDKHLRVHGMAFLNRKRIEAQNAARNPEKRAKMEKPEDSCDVASSKNDDSVDLKIRAIEPLNGVSHEFQKRTLKE